MFAWTSVQAFFPTPGVELFREYQQYRGSKGFIRAGRQNLKDWYELSVNVLPLVSLILLAFIARLHSDLSVHQERKKKVAETDKFFILQSS